MELDSKPTETNMVLVNDKFLMALLAAEGILASHIFVTGWPSEPQEYTRDFYMAYKQTEQVKHLIKSYEAKTATVNLEAYLSAEDELGNNVGRMTYLPREFAGTENE